MASDPARPCPRVFKEEDITEYVAKSNADAIADGFKLLFGGQDKPPAEEIINT